MKHQMKTNEYSIYKYCNYDKAILILEKNQIRLNTANNFNDPYDAKILFSDKDIRVSSDIIMNYYGEIAIREVLEKHYKKFPLRHKLLALPARLNLYLNQKSNKKFQEYRPAMNFSGLIRLFNKLGLKNGEENSASQKALEDITNLRDDRIIENAISKNLMEKSEELLISCFSKSSSSVLMWSHYANNNKGVCIEFENENFLEVVYSIKRSIMRTKQIIYKILWGIHSGSNLVFQNTKKIKYLLTIAPLLTKSKDWEYENEVRCILPITSEKVIQRDNMYFYKMKNIKSITLGCRVSQNEKLQLVKICKNKNLHLYEMLLSKDSYELVRNRIF